MIIEIENPRKALKSVQYRSFCEEIGYAPPTENNFKILEIPMPSKTSTIEADKAHLLQGLDDICDNNQEKASGRLASTAVIASLPSILFSQAWSDSSPFKEERDSVLKNISGEILENGFEFGLEGGLDILESSPEIIPHFVAHFNTGFLQVLEVIVQFLGHCLQGLVQFLGQFLSVLFEVLGKILVSSGELLLLLLKGILYVLVGALKCIGN